MTRTERPEVRIAVSSAFATEASLSASRALHSQQTLNKMLQVHCKVIDTEAYRRNSCPLCLGF